MKMYHLPQFIAPALVLVVLANIVFGMFSVQKITRLEKQVAMLQGNWYGSGYLVNGKTQDEAITDAVESISPSVVSIVITREIPNIDVEYGNPFEDNSFFKRFNIRIPYYKENGTVEEEIGGGTGFIISTDGYIVTNKHVVSDEDAGYTVLLSSGEQKEASVVYKDSQNDIAIIKIEGNYKPIEFGDSSNIKVGQTVIAIGNALGEYNNSVSVGIVSGLDRSIRATDGLGRPEDLEGVIQTDAAINRGNSGGPLVDLQGRVIGINVATVVGSSNISFAIPINEVKDILRNIFSI